MDDFNPVFIRMHAGPGPAAAICRLESHRHYDIAALVAAGLVDQCAAIGIDQLKFDLML